jgi:hypothetical protein
MQNHKQARISALPKKASLPLFFFEHPVHRKRGTMVVGDEGTRRKD